MLDAMARHMQSGDTGLSDLAEQALRELIEERSGNHRGNSWPGTWLR